MSLLSLSQSTLLLRSPKVSDASTISICSFRSTRQFFHLTIAIPTQRSQHLSLCPRATPTIESSLRRRRGWCSTPDKLSASRFPALFFSSSSNILNPNPLFIGVRRSEHSTLQLFTSLFLFYTLCIVHDGACECRPKRLTLWLLYLFLHCCFLFR